MTLRRASPTRRLKVRVAAMGRSVLFGRHLGTVGVVLAFDGGSRVAAQLAMVLTARLLGPGEFGHFAVALTVFGLVTLLADAGVGDSALQRLTTQADAGERFRAGPAPRRLQLGALVTVGAIVLSAAAAATGWLSWSTALICTAVPAWVVITNAALELRALERFRKSATVSSALNLTQAVLPLIVTVRYPNAVAAAAAASAGLWLLALRRVRQAVRRPDTHGVRPDLLLGLPFLASGLAVALYTRGDRLVLATLGDAASTGLYSAAYTLALGASLLGTAVQVVTLPHALRQHALSIATWPAVRRRILQAWVPSALIVGLTPVFAGPIVGFLFGDAYAPAAKILTVLSPIIPMYVINPYLATLLIAARHERAVTRVAFRNLLVASALFPAAVLAGGAVYLAGASVLVELTGHVQMISAVRRMLMGGGSVADSRNARPNAPFGRRVWAHVRRD